MTRSNISPDQGQIKDAPSRRGGSNFIDLKGRRFNKLLVIERAPNKGRDACWACDCDCGQKTVVRGQALREGDTQSCGCLGKQVAKTHGMSHTLTYRSWHAMVARCTNPKDPTYARYAGKGICDRWVVGDGTRGGLECFLIDIGERPSPGHTLDRIDNEKGYSPGNVRWATWGQQQNNRRDTPQILYLWRLQTVTQWSRELQIHKNVLYYRLKEGWSIDRAFTQPLRKKRDKAEIERERSGGDSR